MNIPKTELEKTAEHLVLEALREKPTCSSEEWSSMLKIFDKDCDAAGADSTTLLISTAAQLTRAVLAATPQKPLQAPPLVLSKLRPKAAGR